MDCIPYNKEHVLWNNLPYVGLYTESFYSGTTQPTQTLPKSTAMHLIGNPLPVINDGVDKSLKLIGFTTTTVDGPVTAEPNGRLVPFSPWLCYRVTWKTSKPCIIGFYTANYLTCISSELAKRSILHIGKNGPCIFNGNKGRFTTDYLGQLFVITNSDVTVTLCVETKNPGEISFPLLKLFKQVPYKEPCGCVYAIETKLCDVDGAVSFVPVNEYIKVSTAMIDFLLRRSVLLDFTPIVGINRMLNAVPKEILFLEGVPMIRNDNTGISIYGMNLNNLNLGNKGCTPVKSPNPQVFSGVRLPASTNSNDPQTIILAFNLSFSSNIGESVSAVGVTDDKGFQTYISTITTSFTNVDGRFQGDVVLKFDRSKGVFEINVRTSKSDPPIELIIKNLKVSLE